MRYLGGYDDYESIAVELKKGIREEIMNEYFDDCAFGIEDGGGLLLFMLC